MNTKATFGPRVLPKLPQKGLFYMTLRVRSHLGGLFQLKQTPNLCAHKIYCIKADY